MQPKTVLRRLAPLLLALALLPLPADAIFVYPEGEEPESAASPQPAASPAPTADDDGGITFVSAPSEAPTEEPDAQNGLTAVEILITAAGDVTFGGNMRKNPASNMYTKIVDTLDGDFGYFFENVQEYFATDDMTLVNFEGVLTERTRHKDNPYCFRAPKEHVAALTLGSVEAVALENNHVMDFYEEGYQDTLDALNGAGIVYASEGDMGVYETKGVSIAMLAYQLFDNQYPRLKEQVPEDIAAARDAHDIVIVSYHWGVEEEFAPHERQVELGRLTIDAGADLVLGHHSHRVQPIERYQGKYIVYSLANCSFSGNTKPANMDTFLFQQKFIVSPGQVTVPGDFRIIPCSISSITAESGAVSGQNDLVVTPFASGSDAAQRVVQTMLDNSKGLAYAVDAYPTEWP